MPVTHLPPTEWTGRHDPEDGAAARRMHHLMSDTGSRALIGFACEAGVLRNKGRPGAKEAPHAIRQVLSGLASPANARSIVDLGTVDVEGDDLEHGQAELARALAQALLTHERIIVLGGGHETAYGSYLGLAAAFPGKQIGIINFDAHLDLRNASDAGPSSGTPFNQIRQQAPEQFQYLCLGVAEESNTQALFQRAHEWHANYISDKALQNTPDAAYTVIDRMIEKNDLIYLTIDIDLLPHYQAPGVSAPAARGVPFYIVEHLVGYILASCAKQSRPLPLADIVEVSPPYDKDMMTARTAAFLVRQILTN